MLLDIVAGAISRNSRFGFSAKQFVHRHPEGVPHQIPECKINAADGVDYQAGPAVVHAGPPQNVPDTLDIEGILSHEQLGEMLLNDIGSAGSAASVTLHALVRCDLDRERGQLS